MVLVVTKTVETGTNIICIGGLSHSLSYIGDVKSVIFGQMVFTDM